MTEQLQLVEVSAMNPQFLAEVEKENLFHQEQIALIMAKAPGTWLYNLEDENARHCRRLERLVAQAHRNPPIQ